MVTFDLTGKDVGSRLVRSIRRASTDGPVVLKCAGARFVAPLELSDLTIFAADFKTAKFPHGIRLQRVKFKERACFDDAEGSDFWLESAHFADSASFRGLKSANLKIEDASFERYASFDRAILGFGNFRDVTFGAEARFRKVTSRGNLTFRSVCFAGPASFQNGVIRDLGFPGCEFEGPFQSSGLEVERTFSLVGSSFADTRLLELRAGNEVVLREASFAQTVVLVAATPSLQGVSACFERGADILLEPGSEATFTRSALFGPSLISTRPSENGAAAKVVSLDRARVERLILEDLDLSECSLARLHRLDDVLISGRGQLALAPAVIEGSYRREVLADEALRRANGSRMLQWVPISWRAPVVLEGQEKLGTQAISDTYRALRKAREDSHDFPGAADFYYGEMEMRREGAGTWVERLILTLYWLVSGYGMRAGRTVLTFVVAVLLLAAGFQTIGLQNPPSFTHTLGWTLSISISLTKPVEKVDLSTAGIYLNVVTRILGPALLALAVLALRSRVRR